MWIVRAGTGAALDSKLGYYHDTTEMMSMLNRKTRLLSIGLAFTFRFAFVSKVAEDVLLGATMPKQGTAAPKPPVTNLEKQKAH
jgi:hypothetical protein